MTKSFEFNQDGSIILIDSSNIEYSFSLHIEIHKIVNGTLSVFTSEYSGLTTNFGLLESTQIKPNQPKDIEKKGVHHLEIRFSALSNTSSIREEYLFQQGMISSLAITPYFLLVLGLPTVIIIIISVYLRDTYSKKNDKDDLQN